MAKKNKDEEEFIESDGEKGGSRFVTVLTVIIIVLIWLVIFGILIKTDLMGFGSSVLAPVLKDVPVLNMILPDYTPDEENSDDSVTGINDDAYASLEEANAEIRRLREELIEKTEKVENNKDTISSQEKDIKKLKKYKEAFDEFDELKRQFDEEVVFGDSALPYEDYMKFYESIEPETAEELYRECVELQQADQKIQTQAEIYAAMDAETAAAIMENMPGDLDLVCQILKAMKEDQASAIIGAMGTNFASKVTKKMSIMD